MTRTLAEVALEASTCTRCKLAGMGRTQVVFGVGHPDADLMFIGEAPGFHEDKQGEPFVGAAGQLLNRLLEGIQLAREDVYIANVLRCRPPGNRDPEPDEIEACTPWLVETISLVQPRLIMTLGNFATKYVLQTTQGITRMRGTVHSWHGRTVIPTFHPAAILHGGGEKSPQFQDMREDFALVQRTLAAPAEREPAEPAAEAGPAAAEPEAAEPAAAAPAAEAPRVVSPSPAAEPLRATPGMAARPDRPLIVPAPPDEEQLELF